MFLLPLTECYPYRTEQMIFLSLLLSMILMGNMIVIMSLGCSRGRKSRMNFFILHLAIAGSGDISSEIIYALLPSSVYKIIK